MNKQESKESYSSKEEFAEIEKASNLIVRSKPIKKKSLIDDDSYEPNEISYKAAFYRVYPKTEQDKIIKKSKDDKGIEDTELSSIVDEFFRGVSINYAPEKFYDIKAGEIWIRSKRALSSQQLEIICKRISCFNYRCTKRDITGFSEIRNS